MAKRAMPSESLSFDPELSELPREVRWREWMNRVEAVLFAAPSPVERKELSRVIGREVNVELIIDDIRADLQGKPYDIVRVAGGWQMRTRAGYAEIIQASRAVPERRLDFSQTELMVLVSIAYHQPITRAGVSEILGREASRDVLGALREKDMITAGPRSPTPGAPLTYVTTRTFLSHFGLQGLRDLPDVEALEDSRLLAGKSGAEVGRPGFDVEEE